MGIEFQIDSSANMQIDSLVDLDFEMMREAFGDAYDFITFGGGFGIKREPDNPAVTDYIFWGGLFNTFFWFDPTDDSIGVFLTSHLPATFQPFGRHRRDGRRRQEMKMNKFLVVSITYRRRRRYAPIEEFTAPAKSIGHDSFSELLSPLIERRLPVTFEHSSRRRR